MMDGIVRESGRVISLETGLCVVRLWILPTNRVSVDQVGCALTHDQINLRYSEI
jgi:hypothetical protein